jgi:tetratricopeptide (TPR) repeat protein
MSIGRSFLVSLIAIVPLAPARAAAAVPGAHAEAATQPRLLHYADERALPAAEREAVFEEYVQAERAALAAADFARAHELATRATAVFPRARRAWNHLAAARVHLSQWGPAIEAARRAETLRDDTYRPTATADESHAGAAYWEGIAMFRTQRYDEALARLRVARERAPDWAEGARALGECIFVGGKAEAALPDYAAAFALDPGIGTTRDLSYYAEAQAASGDVAGGIAAIQEALRRQPLEPGLHAKLGDLLRREGRLADAYYEFVYEVVLHGLESRFARSSVSMQNEIVRQVRAAHPHQHASEDEPVAHAATSPLDADAHEILVVSSGLQSLESGAKHRALRQFRHALAGTRSASPMPHILFADALLRDGQAKQAEDVLQTLLRTQTDCVPALYLLAEAQQGQGRASDASRTRERVQALYPEYWRLRSAQRRDG